MYGTLAYSVEKALPGGLNPIRKRLRERWISVGRVPNHVPFLRALSLTSEGRVGRANSKIRIRIWPSTGRMLCLQC